MYQLMKASIALCLVPAALGWSLSLPRKVLYIDSGFDYNDPGAAVSSACSAGYNVVYLAFYLYSTPGPFDMAASWGGMTPARQQEVIADCHAVNAAVMVSYGGATENPYGASATTEGQAVANWALQNNLDGVDFDLENFGPGMTSQTTTGAQLTGAQTVAWLKAVTLAARGVLGTNNKFISHAPQAPYFGPVGDSSYWPGSTGGYSGVYQDVGSSIDWLNVQFYNQGATCYTTQTGLFTTSSSDCSDFPGTSVAEIASYGIPASKIVVGKYDPSTEASNGYVSASNLHTWLSTHTTGGFMIWQWKSLAQVTAFVQTVYPGGTPTAPTPATPTAAPPTPVSPTPKAPTPKAPTAKAPTPASPTASPPTAGGAVSSCAAAGQSSLCSINCASTCRGFAPYYDPGCLSAAACTNPESPDAQASACSCSGGTSPSAPAPTSSPPTAPPTLPPTPGSSPTAAPPTSSGAVSKCSDVGQQSLCSINCASTCRGFEPYFSSGCALATACSNPANAQARASTCSCV